MQLKSNINVILGGCGNIYPIIGWKITLESEVSHTLHKGTKKDLKHFRSNGWLSLPPILSFARLRVDSKISKISKI